MENQKRSYLVGFRVSDAERRMIEALAQKMERNLSDAVRYVMRQAAREMLVPVQDQISGGEVCRE